MIRRVASRRGHSTFASLAVPIRPVERPIRPPQLSLNPVANECSSNYTRVMSSNRDPSDRNIDSLRIIRFPDGEFGQRGQQWERTTPPPPVAQNVAPQTPPPSSGQKG